MIKQALIGNCSHSEWPVIEILHEQGYAVTSLGADVTALCSDQVCNHTLIDYSDLVAVGEYLADNKFDLYIPACNELFLNTVCQLGVSELFGLGDDQLLMKMIDKRWIADAFRGASILKSAARVTLPSLNLISDAELKKLFETFPGGFFLKPIIGAGGKDISVIRSIEEFKAYATGLAIDIDATFIAEERLKGREYSILTPVFEREVLGHYWDVEISNSNTHQIDASFWHKSLRPSWIDEVFCDIRSVVAECGIESGLFHLQIIDDPSKGPVVLDVTRRLSGDLYGKEMLAVTGFDLNRFFLECIKKMQGKSDWIPPRLAPEREWQSFFRFVVTNPEFLKGGQCPISLKNFSPKTAGFNIYCCSNGKHSSSDFNKNKRFFICHFTCGSEEFHSHISVMRESGLIEMKS